MSTNPILTFRAMFEGYQSVASQLKVFIPGPFIVEVYRHKKNAWRARNPTSRADFTIEEAATAAEAAARVAKLFRNRTSSWTAFRDGTEDTRYSPPEGDFFAGAEDKPRPTPAGSPKIRHAAAPYPQNRKNQVRTVCGKHVAPHLIASQEEAVTCATCL